MKKYITKVFLATIILAGIASCQKEEDRVFDKSVAERLSEQEQKLQDLLLSSEYGWKLVYQISPDDFGGFTYLMRFKDSRNVEMVSDFNKAGTKIETTEYAIHQRATTSLVFTTRTKIHELSDPMNSPYNPGAGFFGEYQFGYYGNTENEIYFRTPKQDQEITFVKATKEDWENFKIQYENVEGMYNPNMPYFRVLEITEGGVSKKYELSSLGSVRMFEINGAVALNAENRFSLTFNSKGATIYPGIKVGGKEATDFVYNPISHTFDCSVEGNKVSIQYANEPFAPINSYLKLVKPTQSNRLFLYRGDLPTKSARGNSPLFTQSIADLGKDGAGQDNLFTIQVKFKATDLQGLNYIMYIYKGEQHVYAFLTQDGQGALKIIELAWATPNPPKEIVEFNKKLMQDKVYVKLENYRLLYSYPVITFIGNKESMAFSTYDLGNPRTF